MYGAILGDIIGSPFEFDMGHGGRVLRIVKLHDLRRTAQKTAVVGGDLQALQRGFDFRLDVFKSVVFHQQLKHRIGMTASRPPE